MVYHICRIFSFSAVRPCKRHLAAVLLENDKICPIDHLCRFVPTLSQQLREDFA